MDKRLGLAAFLFLVVALAASQGMWVTCLLAALGASECAYRYGRRNIKRKSRAPNPGAAGDANE